MSEVTDVASAIRDSFILNDVHENVIDALNAIALSIDTLARVIENVNKPGRQ